MSTAERNPAAAAESSASESGAGKKYFPYLRRFIIFSLALLWFGVFAPLGIDLHHDGVMFIPALRVANGDMVFRDVFCQYGMLSPVLQALALKLGGAELLTLKYFMVLFYAGSAVMLDIIWQQLLTPRWRDLMLLMFFTLMPDTMVTFHPWSSIFALFFSLISLWGQLKYLKQGKWYWLLFSGAMAGVTFLSRHPSGVVTLLAVWGTLFFEMMTVPAGWKARIRKFVVSCGIAGGGFVSVAGIAAAIIIAAGAWDDFVFQCITAVFGFVHARGGSGDSNYLGQSLFPFVTSMGYFDSIFAVLPLTALFQLLSGVRKAVRSDVKAQESLSLIALVIFALGSWHQYYPVPCVRHLFWAGVPFFGVFVLSIRELLQSTGERRWLCRILAAGLLLVFCACASVRIYSGCIRLATAGGRAVSEIPGLKGMKLTRGEDSLIRIFRSTLESLPENIRQRGVVNYTPDGLWSVILPDAGFKHRQFLLFWEGLYKDYDEKIIEFVREKRPVVLSSKMLLLEYYEIRMMIQYMGIDYYMYVPMW